MRRPASVRITTAPVTNPSAPTWISTRITASPNAVQWSAVETTVRPVTQTAEVAVKSAVMTSVPPPSLAKGSSSNMVPTAIRPAKPAARVTPGRDVPGARERLPACSRWVARRRSVTTRSDSPRGSGIPGAPRRLMLIPPPKSDAA